MNRTSIRLGVCGLVVACLIEAAGLSAALSSSNPSPEAPSADNPGLISRVELLEAEVKMLPKLEAEVKMLRSLHANVLGNSLTGLWYQDGDKKAPCWLFQLHDNNIIFYNSAFEVGIGKFKDPNTMEIFYQKTGFQENGTIGAEGKTIQFTNVRWTRQAGP
jgi:hypothetical protein